MVEFAMHCARSAGDILMSHLDKIGNVRQKENQSSIVTEADKLSEEHIIKLIQGKYPEVGVISEESGAQNLSARYVWVVDPLDGTSNYAAGIPWFGVLIAILEDFQPVAAVAYIPSMQIMYAAERGNGAYRNCKKINVTEETDLKNVLCGYGLDYSQDVNETKRQTEILARLCSAARNVRMTNCLIDMCYTADGRFGGCINHNTRIWDIASPALLIQEAGGMMTELSGAELSFNPETGSLQKSYAVVAGSKRLHSKLVELCKI